MLCTKRDSRIWRCSKFIAYAGWIVFLSSFVRSFGVLLRNVCQFMCNAVTLVIVWMVQKVIWWWCSNKLFVIKNDLPKFLVTLASLLQKIQKRDMCLWLDFHFKILPYTYFCYIWNVCTHSVCKQSYSAIILEHK